MSITREKIAAALREEWKLRLLTPRWPVNRDEVRATVLDRFFTPFAFPGGYQVIFTTSDGDTLCVDCAKTAVLENRESVTRSIHWEGEDEHCDDCGKELPSAYGTPDDDQDAPGTAEAAAACDSAI